MKLALSNKLVRGIQKRNKRKQPIQSITLKCEYAEKPEHENPWYTYSRCFKTVPNETTVYGTLSVENIDWTFYFNNHHYTVYCSLKPGKAFTIYKENLILKYLHYFTNEVASYVQFFDVQSALCPFTGMYGKNAKIRSIKLKIFDSEHYWFYALGFGCAEFEKIEFYNSDIDTTASYFSDYFIGCNYTKDSFITAMFSDKNTNFHVEIWELLILKFPEAELSRFQNKKCLILKEDPDFYFVVFREISSDSDNFTIIKVLKSFHCNVHFISTDSFQ